MVAKFWGVAGLKTGVKALGERREFSFGRQRLPEPACNAAAREGLEAAGFEVFAPAIVEQRWRYKRNGERVKAKNAAFPLFPGYVFFGWNDFDHWCDATHARGVSEVLRDGDRFARPALVSHRTMTALLAAGPLIDSLAAAQQAAALEAFEVGQRVTIKSGPFAGMIARILSFKGKKRMKAFLELESLGTSGLGQGFDLEVETCELTKR